MMIWQAPRLNSIRSSRRLMSNGEASNIPAWLHLVLAGITGAVIAVGTMVKLAFSFNTRLQRIENQDLESIIDRQIALDRHNNLYPMLQTRVYAELDKQGDVLAKIDRDVAVLLERDRLAQRMERIIAALNRDAMKDQDA